MLNFGDNMNYFTDFFIELHKNQIAVWFWGTLILIFIGMSSKYLADKYTDRRRIKELQIESEQREKKLEEKSKKNIEKKFSEILQLMPKLLQEMKDDLLSEPFVRELIAISRKGIYNADKNKKIVAYYFEDHEDLLSKLLILEGCGFIKNVAFNDVERYNFTEDFVSLLQRQQK